MNLYRVFRSFFRMVFSALYRWQVIGEHHIPKEGPVIICCNHISNWDPLLLGCSATRQIHYMAKEELFRIPGISWLLKQWGAFPVKRGAGDRASIRTALALLEEGKTFGIFPEGTRSRTGELQPGLPGVALFALKSDAVVIPAAVVGPYRLFRPLKLVFGTPVDLSRFRGKSGSDTLRDATDVIMNEIRHLLEQHRS